MTTLLQIDFPNDGPFGAEMSAAYKELAESIAQEAGFIWKIWTENAQTKRAGGIYLFEDETSAKQYAQMHMERLRGFGINEFAVQFFEVNVPLSLIDNAHFLAEH